jgi:hypothetical protein
MEAIILEPKNIDELKAVRKAIKEIGIRSFRINDSEKIYLLKLKKSDYVKGKFIDSELESKNKKDRVQLAKYKLATLSKRNPKASASMELINEVIEDIRKPINAKKKR